MMCEEKERIKTLETGVDVYVKKFEEAQNKYEKMIQEQEKKLEQMGKELEKCEGELYNALVGLSLLKRDDDISLLPKTEISHNITVDDIQQRLGYKYSSKDAATTLKNIVTVFLCALNTTQIITLHGKPGTGKTTFVDRMSTALGAKLTMISVQNNWTDSSDLLGFYNPINNSYQSTPFLDALLDAQADWARAKKEEKSPRLHIICLDEMNLARIEYYFATFLSLLQLPKEKRKIQLLPSDVLSDNTENKHLERYKNVIIPPNVRFVGTLNFDETATIPSPKVVDRSFYISFDEVKTGEISKQEIDDYIPASFFEKEEDLDYAPEENRNARHLKYAREMHAMAAVLHIEEESFKELLKKGRPKCEELRKQWENQMFGDNV